MKKIFLSIIILSVCLIMFGCDKKDNLENNISELTQIYFSAECQGLEGNISVGYREVDYAVDGLHTQNCEFSLVAIKFDNLLPNNQIEVEFYINNQNQNLTMDLNPSNHFYMADLGFLLDEDDELSLKYGEYNLNFINISKDFSIDFNDAIRLAKDELNGKLNHYFNGKNFEAECYLKILAGQKENKLFWAFTVVGKSGNRNNVVISVEDGNIILSE